LLLQLIAGAGMVRRELAGLAQVPKEKRHSLRRLGVTIGTLDIFVPALLKPGPRRLLQAIGMDRRPAHETMAAVIEGSRTLPSGYRPAGARAIRIDMAEKLFRAAHDGRSAAHGRRFRIDAALGTSMGLTGESFVPLLQEAGFRQIGARALAEGAFGPPAPPLWEWRPPRPDSRAEHAGQKPHRVQRGKGPPKDKRPPPKPAPEPRRPVEGNAFAALADLIR
jgi:ATP-dependent RNA helicase SUPV3L1/SUV3